MHDGSKDRTTDNELRNFEQGQARELQEFEGEQRRELQAFEERERQELQRFEDRAHHQFTIKIDRTEYKVRVPLLTGAQIRRLPTPPIGDDRDLFEVVPGGSDRKISDETTVTVRDGLRFFTAPAQINPGAS